MKFSKIFSIIVLSLLLGCSQPSFGFFKKIKNAIEDAAEKMIRAAEKKRRDKQIRLAALARAKRRAREKRERERKERSAEQRARLEGEAIENFDLLIASYDQQGKNFGHNALDLSKQNFCKLTDVGFGSTARLCFFDGSFQGLPASWLVSQDGRFSARVITRGIENDSVLVVEDIEENTSFRIPIGTCGNIVGLAFSPSNRRIAIVCHFA